MYLSTEKEWSQCKKQLYKAKLFGLDSEFVGVDFSKGDSCVNKAEIHVWSVAILTNKFNPRGYYEAEAAVLPRAAIPFFRDILEDETVLKPAHNSNVDVHAFWNAGVDVLGVINTLSLARWMLPGRMRYNLDDLSTDCLGVGKADSFDSLCRVQKWKMESKWKTVKVKECLTCGRMVCRRRKYPHIKTVIEEQQEIIKEVKDGWEYIDQRLIIPGHPLWERYSKYAMWDAARAVEIYDFLNRIDKETEVIWYPN